MQSTPKEQKPKQAKKSPTRPKAKIETKWSQDKLVKIATQIHGRHQEYKPRPPKIQSETTKKKNGQSTPKTSFN